MTVLKYYFVNTLRTSQFRFDKYRVHDLFGYLSTSSAIIKSVINIGLRILCDEFKQLSIGQLAKQANSKVETVHCYEKTDLMPEPSCTKGDHRLYIVAF